MVAKKYFRKEVQLSWFCSSCNIKKCFSLIARLCFWGSSRPIPPCVLDWYKVFLAIGSFVVYCQMCLKIFVSIWVSVWVGIGNILLRKVTFERINVFNRIAFPLRKRCLRDSCCNCFSKIVVQRSELKVIVFCKSVVK